MTLRDCEFTGCSVSLAGPPLSERSKDLPKLTGLFEVGEEPEYFTSHTVENDVCTVSLSMADSQGEILEMKFICADEEQAGKIKKKFRREAERIYHKIIELFEE